MAILPQSIIVLRSGGGTIGTDGRPSRGTPSLVSPTPLISVQPVTGRDMVQRLPEGARIANWRALYSDTLLQTADQYNQTMADLVSIDGATYSVEMVDDWTSGLIPHCFALCVRLKETP